MSDVGLHRSDEQRLIAVAILAVGAGDGPQFDGIAHRRTRTVRLKVVHL